LGEIQPIVEDMYVNRSENGGRPNYDEILMVNAFGSSGMAWFCLTLNWSGRLRTVFHL